MQCIYLFYCRFEFNSIPLFYLSKNHRYSLAMNPIIQLDIIYQKTRTIDRQQFVKKHNINWIFRSLRFFFILTNWFLMVEKSIIFKLYWKIVLKKNIRWLQILCPYFSKVQKLWVFVPLSCTLKNFKNTDFELLNANKE